jgi:hypothetical protein
VELSKEPLHNQGAFLSHANAQLTPRARLRLARLVLEQGWICTAAAKMFTVSPRTAAKWASRYRSDGPVGMVDRRRPHRSPTKTPPAIVMSGWRDLNSRPLDPQVGAARRRTVASVNWGGGCMGHYVRALAPDALGPDWAQGQLPSANRLLSISPQDLKEDPHRLLGVSLSQKLADNPRHPGDQRPPMSPPGRLTPGQE